MDKRRREREQAQAVPTRPYAGLAYECDLVAMREFVPSAMATLPVHPQVSADREITVAAVMPGAVAALVAEQDEVAEAGAHIGVVGMEVHDLSGSVVEASA